MNASNPQFGDPNVSQTSFVKLHEILESRFSLKSANIRWNSGDNAFDALQNSDPTRYYGGFNARVRTKGTNETPSIDLPVLPNFSIVTRKNAHGEKFDLYTSTTMRFVLFTARARAVIYKREGKDNKVVKNKNGYPVVMATAKTDKIYEKASGYSPNAEIFGFVVDENNQIATPFVFSIDSWSSWRSYYSKETQGKLTSIQRRDGFLPVYEIGTRGKKSKDGDTVPVLIEYNGGFTTPIESFIDNVAHVKITDQMTEILNAVQEWRNCPAWNSVGAVAEEKIETVAEKFQRKAAEIGLSDQEAAKIVYQNSGDYSAALLAIDGDVVTY